MSIATIDNVKLKMWTETLSTFQEARVQFYLDSTEPLLKGIFWDMNLSEKTESIKICDFEKNNYFYAENINPVSIVSINGTAYTGVLWTDYKIIDRKIIINDLNSYLVSDFPYVDITYNSWFDPLPWDIVYLHTCIVVDEYNKEGSKDLKNYTAWPRKYEYFDVSEQSQKVIEAIKSKYLIPYV